MTSSQDRKAVLLDCKYTARPVKRSWVIVDQIRLLQVFLFRKTSLSRSNCNRNCNLQCRELQTNIRINVNKFPCVSEILYPSSTWHYQASKSLIAQLFEIPQSDNLISPSSTVSPCLLPLYNKPFPPCFKMHWSVLYRKSVSGCQIIGQFYF